MSQARHVRPRTPRNVPTGPNALYRPPTIPLQPRRPRAADRPHRRLIPRNAMPSHWDLFSPSYYTHQVSGKSIRIATVRCEQYMPARTLTPPPFPVEIFPD